MCRFTPTRVGKSNTVSAWVLVMVVHPHTCGEITRQQPNFKRFSGSPPHVWGNHNRRVCRVAGGRFTPTRVGKSPPPGISARWWPVHPHTCGEIRDSVPVSTPNSGSPPHVWGNPQMGQVGQMGQRFTPTRVGKSRIHGIRTRRGTVHPHTCGEIQERDDNNSFPGGSPPHVWGNLPLRAQASSAQRFTPTRVGKSGSGLR